MPDDRATPFSLVFAPLAAEHFPVIRDAVAAAGIDPADRDAFLLLRQVNQLMQLLRPEEGLGEGVSALAALVHAAWLHWAAGCPVEMIDEHSLRRLLADPGPGGPSRCTSPAGAYIQLPPLRVWGRAVEAEAAEPLDGWFLTAGGDRLGAVAVFGLHPGRGGLTVVEVAGPPPAELRRLDGSALFTPTIPGGREAGLASLEGAEELLELAWRVETGR